VILVDSSVWISYFNGIPTWQTDLLDNYLSNVPVVIGDLILSEVLQGFRSDKDYETAKNFLSTLPFRQIGGYRETGDVHEIITCFNVRALQASRISI
jgi:predicted nucleic acid-binding protein